MTGHKRVLNTLDAELLTSVNNAELKADLARTRGDVEHHLAEAVKLQAKLRGDAKAVSAVTP